MTCKLPTKQAYVGILLNYVVLLNLKMHTIGGLESNGQN